MNAIVITLDTPAPENKKRRDNVRKWVSRFQNHIHPMWFRVEPHHINSSYGNFRSIHNVINFSAMKGQKYVLIMEDDAMPTEHLSIPKILDTIQALDTYQPNWECLYLGYYNAFPFPFPENDVKPVEGVPGVIEALCVASHAFVVSSRGMKRLGEELHKYYGSEEDTKRPILPIDLAIIDIYKRCGKSALSFAMIPMMFVQKDGNASSEAHYQKIHQQSIQRWDTQRRKLLQLF